MPHYSLDRVRPEPAEQPWRDRANCRGTATGTFFPDKSHREVAIAARQVCRGCEVRLDCLAYAIVHDEPFGIWGGLSIKQRRTVEAWLVARFGSGWADADVAELVEEVA